MSPAGAGHPAARKVAPRRADRWARILQGTLLALVAVAFGWVLVGPTLEPGPRERKPRGTLVAEGQTQLHGTVQRFGVVIDDARSCFRIEMEGGLAVEAPGVEEAFRMLLKLTLDNLQENEPASIQLWKRGPGRLPEGLEGRPAWSLRFDAASIAGEVWYRGAEERYGVEARTAEEWKRRMARIIAAEMARLFPEVGGPP